MKYIFLCVMLGWSITAVGQSKKKQIEMLMVSKDSIQSLLDKEREDHTSSKTTLTNQNSELNNQINDLNSTSDTQNARIQNLESQLKKLETQLQIKEQENLKKENKIQNLTKEIKNLKKVITENDQLISKKKIIIDSLSMDLNTMNDSLARIIEANPIDSESNWIITDLMGSLQGRWVDDCEYDGPETYKITIDKDYICIGMECEYGGSIKEISYNIFNGQYRINFINDNDIAGDGLPGEFKFYHINNKLSFFNNDNKLVLFKKCKF